MRIFTFLIGETPIDYIQRLRVEKAAIKLHKPPYYPLPKWRIVAVSAVSPWSGALAIIGGVYIAEKQKA